MTLSPRPGHQTVTQGVGAWLVWTIAALAVVGMGVSMWIELASGRSGVSALDRVEFAVWGIALSSFAFSGAVIVSRQPRNVIGWLLMIPGLSVPVTDLLFKALVAMDPPPVSAGPGLWLATWLTGWSWILLIFPLFHLLLTFPSGRLLSPRWRWAVWVEMAMIATIVGLVAFSRDLAVMLDETVVWSVPNPIGFVGEDVFEGAFEPLWNSGLLLITVASATAFVIRFRKASPVERQQFKWLMLAVALFGLVYAGLVFNSSQDLGILDLLFALSVGAIPAAVAIGVLRYRLYEIDRILSRTVTYVTVIVLLAAVYLVGLTAMTSVLPAESPLAVAGSTLAVATLFNPARKRIQDWVDRRFNRSRYDAEKVMERFAGSLQDRLDNEDVVSGWVGVVSETMQPTSVSVWVRDNRDPRNDFGTLEG